MGQAKQRGSFKDRCTNAKVIQGIRDENYRQIMIEREATMTPDQRQKRNLVRGLINMYRLF